MGVCSNSGRSFSIQYGWDLHDLPEQAAENAMSKSTSTIIAGHGTNFVCRLQDLLALQVERLESDGAREVEMARTSNRVGVRVAS
jgi:hypothetical protein